MPAKVVVREFTGDVAALRAKSERIVSALADLGVTHAVGVPDNVTRIIYEQLESHPHVQVVPVCREGEAWAIASGLWVGGKTAIVIIQNTGFLESGDALRGTAIEMAVPLVALIDYRGFHTLSNPEPDAVDRAATLFEPTLKAWQVPYRFLEDKNEAGTFQAAFAEAHDLRRPVAVLMP